MKRYWREGDTILTEFGGSMKIEPGVYFYLGLDNGLLYLPDFTAVSATIRESYDICDALGLKRHWVN